LCRRSQGNVFQADLAFSIERSPYTRSKEHTRPFVEADAQAGDAAPKNARERNAANVTMTYVVDAGLYYKACANRDGESRRMSRRL
jgi:hypothetical protein